MDARPEIDAGEREDIICLLEEAVSLLRTGDCNIGRIGMAMWRIADAGVLLGRLADGDEHEPMIGWDGPTGMGAVLVDVVRCKRCAETTGEGRMEMGRVPDAALLDRFLGHWVNITCRGSFIRALREHVIGRVVMATDTLLVVRGLGGEDVGVLVADIQVIEPWRWMHTGNWAPAETAADEAAEAPIVRTGLPGEAVPGGVWQTTHGVVTDVQSRLQMLAGWDATKCYQAISEGGLQKTVQYALERRIRKLNKLAREGREER